MKLVCICLLAIFGQVFSEKISYRNYTVYKIVPKNVDSLKALRDLENDATEFSPFQFWNGPTKVGHEVRLMVAPGAKENVEGMLHSLNVDQEVMIEDVQKNIDDENRPREDGPNPVDWLRYNTLDEINAWLERLAVDFPNNIQVLKPGKTLQGRDIVFVKLDLAPETPNKEVVFMESNIHAREWITAATNTWILNQFLRTEDTAALKVASNYTWYFFPVMNPDGYVYTHEGNRMWRKTRTRYNIFCYGADPNRNWGYQWMNGGASQNPCSDIYAGPRPFSEPSVAVMRDFIESIAENMVAYLNFHSFSQMLLLPYGHTTDHLDNYDQMMDIGRAALARLQSHHNTIYTIGNIAETIYIAAGSSMDWVKGTFKTPIAYTYELRDLGQSGFILPPEQIIPTATETFDSVIAIFEEWEKLSQTQPELRK